MQAPEPLQVDVPARSLSGSIPFAIGPQVPLLPLPFLAAVHAWQMPAQEVSQQTRSTHWPLAQLRLLTQELPSGRQDSSTSPSQSSSRPFEHVSGCEPGSMFESQIRVPLWQTMVPAAQTPGRPVVQALPPPGFPSSTTPSQLLSIPSQASGIPERLIGDASSQSPAHSACPSPSSSVSTTREGQAGWLQLLFLPSQTSGAPG